MLPSVLTESTYPTDQRYACLLKGRNPLGELVGN